MSVVKVPAPGVLPPIGPGAAGLMTCTHASFVRTYNPLAAPPSVRERSKLLSAKTGLGGGLKAPKVQHQIENPQVMAVEIAEP